jgi:phosphopantetheine adenylyltransferase
MKKIIILIMAEENKTENTSKEARKQIQKASKELFGDIDNIDQLMVDEAKRNA